AVRDGRTGGEEDPLQVVVGEEALVLAVGDVGRIGARRDPRIELEDQVGQTLGVWAGVELRAAVDARDDRLGAVGRAPREQALLERTQRRLDLRGFDAALRL